MKLRLSLVTTAVLFFSGGQIVEAQRTKKDTATTEKQIDEVVIVAYGSQKKETLVGSNTEIKAKQFADRPISNIGQAIDGASPGIKVSTGTGQPGSAPSIQVRGIGSYGISTSPLYVVDGVIYTGSLSAINPNDIASFNILKDAASTSLYGSAAANGVVLITTKSGRKGTDVLNFNMSTGYVGRSIPEYDRVDVYQYYPLIWEAMRNGRLTSIPGTTVTDANTYATANLISGVLKNNVFNVADNLLVVDGVLNPNAQLKYTDLDWQGPLMKTGFRQNYELNYSGGTNKTTYFSSVSYTNETGYLVKSDFERFTARLKVDSQIKSWLKLGTSISGVSSNGNNSIDGADNNSSYINPYSWTRTMGPIYSPYAHDPNTFATLYDADGNVVYDNGTRGVDAASGRNVIQETLLNKDISKNYYIISRAYAEFKVDPYLTLSTNVGYDIRNNRRSRYINKIIGDAAPAGAAEKTTYTEQTLTWNQLLNYKRKFGVHNFEFLLGHENYKYIYEYFNAYKQAQIVDGNDELINFVTPTTVTSQTDNYRKESVFSRLNYDYKSKYLLSGSIRWDASSRFAKNVRWDSFWSVGAGWRIKAEDFLSDSKAVSELKLRGSYGEVGNDGTNSYYMYKSTYTLGYNNAQEPGILFGFLADSSITWEANKQTDLGLDFGFLNNRITGSVDYYNRITEDLIFPVPVPVSSGVPGGNSISKNVGTMYNRGFEFAISADVVKNDNFTWNVNANASTLKNQVTELSQGITEIISGTKKVSVGHSVYDYWLRQWYGVDPADGSPLFLVADAYAGTTASDIRTVNGTQVTTNFNKAKYDYSGTAIPDLFGSFGTSISYKQWSLSTMFTYQLGGMTYDSNYQALMSSYSQGGALSKDILDRWTTPGQITDVPALNSSTYTSSNAASSRWLVKSDFITFRQATLGYSFSPESISQYGLTSLRLLLSGENIWSKTARKGLEPAQSFNGTTTNRYTPARIVTIGCSLSF